MILTSEIIKSALERLQIALALQQELEAHVATPDKAHVRKDTRDDVWVELISAKIDIDVTLGLVEQDAEKEKKEEQHGHSHV